jgi:hypothetical protein
MNERERGRIFTVVVIAMTVLAIALARYLY